MREMTSPEGGWYSAEDADSPLPGYPGESGEGAFYLWTRKELMAGLGESDGRLFCLAHGVEEEGNAPFDPQQEFAGKNILYAAESVADLSRILGKDPKDVEMALERSRRILLAERGRRPRPPLDDKVLASWNGLMVGAFSRAGAILGDAAFLKAAGRAAGFVVSRMLDPHSGRVLHRYRGGEVRFEGHLEDHAFLVSGLIDLYEASAEGRWLEQAAALTVRMVEGFEDREGGGFFDTSGSDPSVLVRLKEHYDGAEPSGNSVAAANLLRLAGYTGRKEWRTLADRVIGTFAEALEKQPVALPNMASALDLDLSPPGQVVIVGRPEDPARTAMVREVHRRYLPGFALAALEPKPSPRPSVLSPDILLLDVAGGTATAYVCENFACSLPVHDPAAVAALLDKPETNADRLP
jgi:uncharacterized protein YyaL (SSP411 family)